MLKQRWRHRKQVDVCAFRSVRGALEDRNAGDWGAVMLDWRCRAPRLTVRGVFALDRRKGRELSYRLGSEQGWYSRAGTPPHPSRPGSHRMRAKIRGGHDLITCCAVSVTAARRSAISPCIGTIALSQCPASRSPATACRVHAVGTSSPMTSRRRCSITV